MSFPLGFLGEYIAFSNGKTSPERTDSGVFPVFGSNGLIGHTDQTNSAAETSVIGRVGSYCGSVHFSKKPCWVTDNAIKATAKNCEEARFWFYAMSFNNLHELRSGSGQPLINQTALKSFELPVPAPEERVSIAAILSTLDDKIELNRRMSATLEEMARSLYRSWFVDFDPVQAKLEGRAPTHMDPATAALFPDSFGENGLPKGWHDGTLDDLIKFNPPERLTKGSDAPYLDMKALPTSGMTHENPIQRAFTSGTKFRQDDTLLARITPCLENGKTALVQNLERGSVAWGSTEFIVMRPTGVVPKAYPYCVARSPEFRDVAIASMTGSSGRQRADAKRIGNIHAAVPPDDVFVEFASITDPMFDKIEQMGAENQTIATLRDTLLPKLMSGELRVGEAREQLEEVV